MDRGQSCGNRVFGELCSRPQPELFHDARLVKLDRLDGDVEDRRNFFRRLSFRDELQDLTLPCAKCLSESYIDFAWGGASRRVDRLIHEALRHHRRHEGASLYDLPNGLDELRTDGLLQNITGHSDAKRLRYEIGFRVHGQHNNFEIGVVLL